MIRICYVCMSRMFMSFRECMVQDRNQEISEQAVADLNVCLDQLLERCRLVETKIDMCTCQAQQVACRISTESPAHRLRSLQQMRQCLLDRKQHRCDHDRASKSVAMLRKQISTILNSHVDSAIINAMRQYSTAASRLGLQGKTTEVQNLTEELAECLDHSNNLQDALGEVSDTFNFASRPATMAEDDEADMEAELAIFFQTERPPPVAAAAVRGVDDDECGISAGEAAAVQQQNADAIGLRQRPTPKACCTLDEEAVVVAAPTHAAPEPAQPLG
jgi:hypothetical protein